MCCTYFTYCICFTVEAARILNVSRPYLIKLLEEKVIPHRLVGKHRRILIDDVVAYKQRIDAKREKVQHN